MALRILRIRCKGEDVRVIQNALNRHAAALDPDGDFGNHTRDAVISFQQDNDLDVDGEVGRKPGGLYFRWLPSPSTSWGRD